MDSANTKLTTRAVISAYIEDRLKKVFDNQIECFDTFLGENFGQHPVVVATQIIAMRNLKFEKIKKLCEVYKTKEKIVQNGINDIVARDIYVLNITSSFFAGLGALTNPNYSWHRVAMAIEITSQLAEEAIKIGHKNRARDLAEWCEDVFKDWSVNLWIRKQGGWESLPTNKLLARVCSPHKDQSANTFDKSSLCFKAIDYETPLSLSPASSKDANSFVTQTEESVISNNVNEQYEPTSMLRPGHECPCKKCFKDCFKGKKCLSSIEQPPRICKKEAQLLPACYCKLDNTPENSSTFAARHLNKEAFSSISSTSEASENEVIRCCGTNSYKAKSTKTGDQYQKSADQQSSCKQHITSCNRKYWPWEDIVASCYKKYHPKRVPGSYLNWIEQGKTPFECQKYQQEQRVSTAMNKVKSRQGAKSFGYGPQQYYLELGQSEKGENIFF